MNPAQIVVRDEGFKSMGQAFQRREIELVVTTNETDSPDFVRRLRSIALFSAPNKLLLRFLIAAIPVSIYKS